MTYTFDGFNWFMVLAPGDKLSASFRTFFKETKCSSAWVQGIGAVSHAELGFYNLEAKQYQWQLFNKPLEVVSLQGNVTLDESKEPMIHLHCVLADENYQTIGGHIKDLTVSITLELFVHRSDLSLRRQLNAETGLQTITF